MRRTILYAGKFGLIQQSTIYAPVFPLAPVGKTLIIIRQGKCSKGLSVVKYVVFVTI